jgi:hypothetical protein
LEAVYEEAASIRLHAAVPERVQLHFAAAQHLLAYSWFYYPFNVTAQFLGYVSVESALKFRYPSLAETGFRKLVKHAVREGVVKDTGFAHIRARREFDVEAKEPWLTQEAEQVKQYVEVLTETMPSLRNSFAHGEYMLHNHGAFHVRICAEFINQLFVEPSPGDG